MKQQIRDFLLSEKSFAVRDPDELQDDTPLIDSGILQSINVIRLIVFLESAFGVRFSAADLAGPGFQTLDSIEALVRQKLSGKG